MATSANPFPNNLSLWRYKRKNKAYTEDLGDGVSLILMSIPTGQFMMGAPESEFGSGNDERPQHLVRVPQFLMGRYLITHIQWRLVAYRYDRVDRDIDPGLLSFADSRPIYSVSWDDAQEFCKRLSIKTGKNYCLPSEAQWEYACRSGTTTPFHFGEIITTEIANFNGNHTYNGSPRGVFRGSVTSVGSFPTNDWGLHDMHGNVWEWCEDNYHSSYDGAPNDGSAWVDQGESEARRVLRGGTWDYPPGFCRSAVRDSASRDGRLVNVGFRVCCILPNASAI